MHKNREKSTGEAMITPSITKGKSLVSAKHNLH
jgi:hypothetical protein